MVIIRLACQLIILMIMSSKGFVFAIASLFILSSCSTPVVTDKGSVVSAVMDETTELLNSQSFFDFFDASLVEYAQQSTLSDEQVTEIEVLIDQGISNMGNASNGFQIAWNQFEGLNLTDAELTTFIEEWTSMAVGANGHEAGSSDAETCGTTSWMWGAMREEIGIIVYGVCCGDFVFAGES